MQGVTIQAVMATGGTAVGPDLGELFRELPRPGHLGSPDESFRERLRTACVPALSTAWREFQASISVPTMSWYPSFAWILGPVAPPTPNTPCLLKELTSGSTLIDTEIGAEMNAAFGPAENESNRILNALAYAFVRVVLNWIGAQKVHGVLGTGPVRMTSLLYGPVVGGTIVVRPGVFWDDPFAFRPRPIRSRR
jgi:hypothetical protein